MQARRRKVQNHVEAHRQKENGTEQVRPYVHCLIVHLKERIGTIPVAVVAHSEASRQVWVVLDEFFKVGVVKVADVRLELLWFVKFLP